MAIKTIPLSRLKANLKKTLDECADSGQALVVEMPDNRLISIQSLDFSSGDSLVDELLQTNPKFKAMAAKSKAAPRKPFLPRTTS